MNTVKIAMLRAAKALRKVAAENVALKSDGSLYKECIKLAFDMASSGRIDDSGEAILAKADELMDKKEKLPVVKEAMEMNNVYNPVGKLVEKTASDSNGSISEREMNLLDRLNEIL